MNFDRSDYELNIKSILNNSMSNSEENIINFLTNIEKIIKCILQDVYIYSKNLQSFLECVQLQFQSNNETTHYMIIKKLEAISDLFYKSVTNHLSIQNCEYGICNKLIKPVEPEYGKTTTIKHYGSKKTFGSRQIQNTINVATLDNISVHKIIDENIVTGYNMMIGELTYVININSKNNHASIIGIINDIKNILDDIEISLDTNIEYIKKCVFVFTTHIK